MATANLTAARLRELLHYDAETGVFVRAVATGRHGCHKAGVVSGYTNPMGYVEISVDNRNYKAHRLAWLYMHGCFPPNYIDHIDGNPSNNRIANLREADDLINAQNIRRAKKQNTSGFLGITKNGQDGWLAKVWADGKAHYLGTFRTKEEAHAVYLAAKRQMHAGCTI